MIAPDDRKAIIQAFRRATTGRVLLTHTRTGYTATTATSLHTLTVNRTFNYVVLSFDGIVVRESVPGKYSSHKYYGQQL